MTDVYLEQGKKRVFACAVQWPGWCRSGKSEEDALAALAAYAPRYARVATAAKVEFPRAAGDDFKVVERVAGSVTTDFGAPGAVPKLDRPLGAAAAGRAADLLAGAWTVFDRVVAGAPQALRKGPRGGGRDRDKVVEHVLGAEVGYGRLVGVKHAQPAYADRAAVRAHRDELLAAIRSGQQPEGNVRAWPTAYAARRIAWHVLDHAWEIEDRSEGS